jgi:hypothetical protein
MGGQKALCAGGGGVELTINQRFQSQTIGHACVVLVRLFNGSEPKLFRCECSSLHLVVCGHVPFLVC